MIFIDEEWGTCMNSSTILHNDQIFYMRKTTQQNSRKGSRRKNCFRFLRNSSSDFAPKRTRISNPQFCSSLQFLLCLQATPSNDATAQNANGVHTLKPRFGRGSLRYRHASNRLIDGAIHVLGTSVFFRSITRGWTDLDYVPL